MWLNLSWEWRMWINVLKDCLPLIPALPFCRKFIIFRNQSRKILLFSRYSGFTFNKNCISYAFSITNSICKFLSHEKCVWYGTKYIGLVLLSAKYVQFVLYCPFTIHTLVYVYKRGISNGKKTFPLQTSSKFKWN